MQTNYIMQTNLWSKATAALLLGVGLVAQVHGQALFFKDDPRKTTNTFAPIVAPSVTNAFEAKVLVVNRRDQTFTIEHEGKLHLFRVDGGVLLFNAKGKLTTLDWVTAGQTVFVTALERPSGRLDLLTANVAPNKQQYAAAGWRRQKDTTPAPEPVVFPSEDARPTVLEEVPVPTDEPTAPVPTDDPQVTPEPQPEPTPETPAPEPTPQTPQPEPTPENQPEPQL